MCQKCVSYQARVYLPTRGDLDVLILLLQASHDPFRPFFFLEEGVGLAHPLSKNMAELQEFLPVVGTRAAVSTPILWGGRAGKGKGFCVWALSVYILVRLISRLVGTLIVRWAAMVWIGGEGR